MGRKRMEAHELKPCSLRIPEALLYKAKVFAAAEKLSLNAFGWRAIEEKIERDSSVLDGVFTN
jgi:predicted HicB family RNase H-like nuclease